MSVNNHSYDPRRAHDSLGDYLNQIGAIDLLSAEDEVELAKQIEAGLYASHLLEEDSDNEPLDATYRQDLGRIAIEGVVARQQMIAANTRLAVSAATHFKRSGYEFDDIIQDANNGLIRAVNGFDYTKGFKFSTYAMWWINQSIFRGIQENGRAIRIPANWHTIHAKIKRIKNEYLLAHGSEPSYDDIAQTYGDAMTVEEVQRIEQMFDSTETCSIDRPLNTDADDDDYTLLDSLSSKADEQQPSIEAIIDADDLSQKTLHLINTTLNAREAKIVKMRLGYYTGEAMTLEEVGDCFDLSRERIRQIVKNALKKLQQHPHMEALRVYYEEGA